MNAESNLGQVDDINLGNISNVDSTTNAKKYTFNVEKNIIQKTVKLKDLTFCVMYQAAGVVWNHPNTGRGTYSQGVYVVKGSYTCAPMGVLPFEVIEKEWVDLEQYKDRASKDTAGPNGVLMIHLNPISGDTEYNIEFIKASDTKTIYATDTRKFIFCLEPEVSVNGVLINTLKYVIMKKNSSAKVVVGENGACVVLEKKDKNFDGFL